MRMDVESDFLAVVEQALRIRHGRTLPPATDAAPTAYSRGVPTTTDDLLLGLDEQQRSAVLSSAPLLAVIAGAGVNAIKNNHLPSS